MKIGILGTGHIGKTLVTRLSEAGHEVKVANSRGPETIDPELLSAGARAVTTDDALTDVEPADGVVRVVAGHGVHGPGGLAEPRGGLARSGQ